MFKFKTKTRSTPVLDSADAKITELTDRLVAEAGEISYRIKDLSDIATELSYVAQTKKTSEDLDGGRDFRF